MNIADMRTVHSRDAYTQLKEHFGDKVFETVIRSSIAYAESAEKAISILDHRPDLGRLPRAGRRGPRPPRPDEPRLGALWDPRLLRTEASPGSCSGCEHATRAVATQRRRAAWRVAAAPDACCRTRWAARRRHPRSRPQAPQAKGRYGTSAACAPRPATLREAATRRRRHGLAAPQPASRRAERHAQPRPAVGAPRAAARCRCSRSAPHEHGRPGAGDRRAERAELARAAGPAPTSAGRGGRGAAGAGGRQPAGDEPESPRASPSTSSEAWATLNTASAIGIRAAAPARLGRAHGLLGHHEHRLQPVRQLQALHLTVRAHHEPAQQRGGDVVRMALQPRRLRRARRRRARRSSRRPAARPRSPRRSCPARRTAGCPSGS